MRVWVEDVGSNPTFVREDSEGSDEIFWELSVCAEPGKSGQLTRFGPLPRICTPGTLSHPGER
jgi:hypothetical protein